MPTWTIDEINGKKIDYGFRRVFIFGRCLRGTFIYRLKSNLGSSSISILGVDLFFRKTIFLNRAPSPAGCPSLTVNWAGHLHGIRICQERVFED